MIRMDVQQMKYMMNVALRVHRVVVIFFIHKKDLSARSNVFLVVSAKQVFIARKMTNVLNQNNVVEAEMNSLHLVALLVLKHVTANHKYVSYFVCPVVSARMVLFARTILQTALVFDETVARHKIISFFFSHYLFYIEENPSAAIPIKNH